MSLSLFGIGGNSFFDAAIVIFIYFTYFDNCQPSSPSSGVHARGYNYPITLYPLPTAHCGVRATITTIVKPAPVTGVPAQG